MGDGFSVVIVDDNDMTRSLLRGILRQQNHRVIGEAKDGDAALALLQKVQPDIVCLDIVMPNSNGLEVLDKIRAAYPSVRVLMITASSDRNTVTDALGRGARGYVVKPFNAARVLDSVEQAMRGGATSN